MWVSQIAGVTSVPGGSVKPFTRSSLSQPAPGERDHRAQAQRLGDHRPQIGLLAGVELGPQARERRGVAQKQVERPGERRRRGLVSGEQQRHQLIAKLGVAHRLAVLEAGRDEHREDVVAACEVRVGAPLGDLGGKQLVDLGVARFSAASGSGPPKRRASSDAELQHWRGGLGEQVGEQRPQPRDARRVAHAEDGAQDHLERHACMRGWIANVSPVGQLSISRAASSR